MEDMILLVGNPNAGKSTLFNRVTRGHATVGNWHGVTVDALEKQTELCGKHVTVVDLPGVYNADGHSMEEKFSCRYIENHPNAAVVFIAECACIERTLPLMNELTKTGRRCMLVLTKRKRFLREGGSIDVRALSKKLEIEVLFAEDDVKEAFARMLQSEKKSVPVADMVGVFTPARDDLSKFDELLTNAFFAVPFFLILLALAFFLTFAKGMAGDWMKSGVEWFFSDYLGGFAKQIRSPVLRGLLADGILRSLGGVLCFLPQIALLHLFLILLEESGLISRLAFLTDDAFSKIGLSGRAVFSLLMGFGCTAAAILTTRGLDDKATQKRVVLCLPYISCSAKLPVYLSLSAAFFENPFLAVLLLYTLGVGISVAVALFLKDAATPLAMELAPLQIPKPIFVAKSLLFQIKQFIIKVATVVLAFFLCSWILSSFDFTFRLCAVEESMLAKICGSLSFLFAPAGMHDWRMTYAALSGLIAKENVAGAIAMFYGNFPFGAKSAFAFSVFILTCSPCVSAIAATAKELGKKRAALYALGQTCSALLLCYLVYFSLSGGALLLISVTVAVFAFMLLGVHREKIHRHQTRIVKRVHRRHKRTGVDVFSHALKGAGNTRERGKDGGERAAQSR